MKISTLKTIFCLTLCLTFPLHGIAISANGTPGIIKPLSKKKAAKQESLRKDALIDSLQRLVREYEERFEREDEIHEELIDIFAENEDRIGAGLKPEDYTPEVTDSLLSIWYLHRNANMNHEGEQYDMETVHFESNVPDKVYKERLAKMNSFITLPYNETVRNYIILYSEKMPTKMQQMLGLADFYMPIFEETFNRYGLPEELKYMAVIESALNPKAISRAGAAGMWQFMHTTGKSYGLLINSYVDERFDVEKAADAAARYLMDAYGIFGDWSLAISSYNCGAGNVNKAIKRSGSRDFWTLYDYLPKETRGYVPAFVGAMYAFRFYKEHGLVPAKVEMPAHVDTFEVHKMLHFKQINEVIGVPVQTLEDLNPQYIHDIVPGNERTYILRLPYSYTSTFLENEDSVYAHRAKELFNPTILDNILSGVSANDERIVYKVKKGDYLGRIASKYHVSVTNLKKWNHLKNNNLRIGQSIIIYRKSNRPASSAQPTVSQSAKVAAEKKNDTAKDSLSTVTSDSTTVSTRTDSVSVTESSTALEGTTDTVQQEKSSADSLSTETEPVVYTVKKGDTLFGISHKFPGVSVKQIQELNKIGTKIQPGMKLKIPVVSK